ncbi:MAG: HEPN domain-containing protein [Deltaproteobacteria bacterium]|nr:HEPN domain-containing protein [Deltaproteobacteria bacterium]
MLRNIEEIRERLVRLYDPDRIILFGSHAKGVAGEESDIDLLIVKQTTDRPIDRRARVEKILADRELPLDIVVYTPEEILRLYSIGSPFIEEVVQTGRVLYMRKAVEGWIKDAEDDLASALVLLEHGRYKAACYHSQQCVEKGLKAVVLEKGGKPAKVHDIVELLNAAKGIGCRIELSMDDAIFLNSVYKGRYPAEDGLLPHGEPLKADASKAVKAAKKLLKEVGSVLKLI